jgi:hypothetical protein
MLIKTLKNLLRGIDIKAVLVFHGSPSPYNRYWDSLKHFDIVDLAWVTTQLVYVKMEKTLGEDTPEERYINMLWD